MQVNNSTVEKLKAVMQQNPELMQLLKSPTGKGRPQGSKNKNTLAPGKQLEIIQEPSDEPEAPTPISMAEAKRLLKANSKPRQYSEEQRKVMLANLAKGREKRKETLAQLKQQVQQKPPVIKKYVIKQRAPKKAKIAVPATDSDNETEYPQTETEDTDAELYKKLKRKERLMKKLNDLQQLAQSKPGSRSATPVPQQRYKLFY